MAVEVGAGYVSVYPDTSSFKSEISKALEGDYSPSGGKAANSFFSAFMGSSVGSLVADIGGTVFDSIQRNFEKGYQRADTLTTFPKVMEGFGYSAELASEKIQMIMDRVQGLPTKTQDVVAFTQQIADSTGDLNLAAEGALAFSDALLASGTSQADQTRAQMVFNRVLGSGTATAQQWSSLMSVIPMQLGMVAKDLLGASASGQDLGAAFREGSVSIEDILRSMVKLDQEGIDGIESFYEQAWNMSQTIENGIGLIDTRIQTMIANIIQELGQENIYNALMGFADGISAAGKVIVGAIQWIKENFGTELMVIQQRASQVGFFLSEIFNGIGAVIGGAFEAITPILLNFAEGGLTVLRDVLYNLSNAISAVSPALSLLGEILGGVIVLALNTISGVAWLAGEALAFVLGWVADHGDVVSAALIAVAAGFTAVQIAMAVSNIASVGNAILGALGGIAGSAYGLWLTLAANPIVAVVAAVAALAAGLIYWFTQTEEGREAWENLKTKVSEVVAAIQENWEGFKKKCAEIWDGIVKGVKQFVDNVVKFFTGLGKSISETWTNIKKTAKSIWDGIVQTITGIVTGLVSAVVGFVTGLASGVAGIWNGMKSTASNVWNGIKSVASNVWGGIKSTIGNLVDGAKSVASTAWNSMKSTASSVWGGIKDTASNLWGGIKSTIGGLVDGIKSSAGSAWSTMGTAASSAWEGMKSKAGSIFGGMRDTLGNIWNQITGKAKDSTTAVQNSINGVKGKSVDLTVNTPGVQSAVDRAKKLVSSVVGKTVYLNLHTYQSGIKGIQVDASYNNNGVHKIATSPIPLPAAKGGYASTATNVIFGEAGAEAIVPFTNQAYMRKLAGAIAEQSPDSKYGGVVVTGNTFVVRNDQDITRVANQLNNMISRQNVGRL